MKKLIQHLFLGSVAICLSGIAAAEVRIGNGGDALAAQFVETADEMIDLIERSMATNHFKLPKEIDFNRLKEKVATAKVFSEDKVYLQNGSEVDALNFPAENKIIFNRDRLRRLVFNLKGQRTLVMHEYLWLAGTDDSSYKNSVYLSRKLANGGDRGELWLLRDITLPGFQNPFLDPIVEFSAHLFVHPELEGGKVTRHFQRGEVVASHAVDTDMPHCVLDVNTIRGGNAGSVAAVRIKIVEALPTAENAGWSEVDLKTQRETLVPRFICRSGQSDRRVTVGDMLDSMGSAIQLEHNGKNCPPCPTCPIQARN